MLEPEEDINVLNLPKAAFLSAKLKISLEDCAALFSKLGTIFDVIYYFLKWKS